MENDFLAGVGVSGSLVCLFCIVRCCVRRCAANQRTSLADIRYSRLSTDMALPRI